MSPKHIAVVSALFACANAQAQEKFPVKNIRMLVPFAAEIGRAHV